MAINSRLDHRLCAAIQHFWKTRERQAQRQGAVSGKKDAGARSAVTGGAQMSGFITLARDLLCEGGLSKAAVFCEKALELPRWYRPEKKWDPLVITITIEPRRSLAARPIFRPPTAKARSNCQRDPGLPI